MLFNGALRYAVSSENDGPLGRLVLSARAGVGPTLPHTESSIEGQRQEQYEVGRVGWQAAGAAEVRLWKGFLRLANTNLPAPGRMGRSFPAQHNLSCAHIMEWWA